MEWIGWISLIIILCWSSYPGKVNKLEKRVKKLERSLREENNMSEIIKALVDKKCKVRSEGGLGFLGSTETICTVLAVDDEWIKISTFLLSISKQFAYCVCVILHQEQYRSYPASQHQELRYCSYHYFQAQHCRYQRLIFQAEHF